MIEKIDCSKDGIHFRSIPLFFFLAFSRFLHWKGDFMMNSYFLYISFNVHDHDLHDDVCIPIFGLSHFFFSRRDEMYSFLLLLLLFSFACARLGGLVF